MAVILFFGGVAAPPILGDDRSSIGAVLAAATLAGLHTALTHLKRLWPTLGMVTEGNPAVIFSNGEWDDAKLHSKRVDPRDVIAEVKQKGLCELSEVQSAIVEHNGAITIVPHEKAD
ncbi:DUF421 domain-containing protein [Methylobacterium gregans]|uniref:DUF421 domain-containing protein n=1 Tax=Methylobacterium gregans TaxID=374424 RepID=UPI001EE21146|nr:YetF domain-containing protein [Methylobacterium gregans]MDQ0524152.1 uncharacterized membrane protein YcaP (DUF421 family) [Methylobacterium gregans]